jgi:thiol-disulfide isomerase/thioredoxin
MYRTAMIATALATAGLLGACSQQDSATAPTPTQSSVQAIPQSPSASAAEEATSGEWITLQQYEQQPGQYHEAGEVVLFFNATWCPTCQETVKNLDSDGAPAGLTVVSVDYDSNQDLRQKYGVTVQHTFVVVSEDGQKKKVFTGPVTGEKIAQQAA